MSLLNHPPKHPFQIREKYRCIQLLQEFRFGFLPLLHQVKPIVTKNVPTYAEIVESSLSFFINIRR